jgi:hypothetical protein
MKKTEASKVSYYCRDTKPMDHYSDIEELENFDHVETDFTELFEESNNFNMNEYLNSNIDY